MLPLINPDGHVLGTFCGIQPSVREWTPQDLTVMKELTASIMTEINLRDQIRKLKAEQNMRDTFVAALTAVYPGRFVLTAEGDFKLRADVLGLRRIVENLASNAAKYGAPGTPIEVRLEQCEKELLLQVRNQGTPIAAEELQSIFEPFHRTRSATESAAKGWGLGLPLVRGLAESHGGKTTVTSCAEQGTCFTITLPIGAASGQRLSA